MIPEVDIEKAQESSAQEMNMKTPDNMIYRFCKLSKGANPVLQALIDIPPGTVIVATKSGYEVPKEVFHISYGGIDRGQNVTIRDYNLKGYTGELVFAIRNIPKGQNIVCGQRSVTLCLLHSAIAY